MSKRIAFVGAGAIGGYIGANLAALGHDVTLIDPWPAHVEAIRSGSERIDQNSLLNMTNSPLLSMAEDAGVPVWTSRTRTKRSVPGWRASLASIILISQLLPPNALAGSRMHWRKSIWRPLQPHLTISPA